MALAKGLSEVKGGSPTFSDVPAGYWAFGVIEAATKDGLFKGYPDGTFNPEGAITRAEAITLLMNISGGALSNKAMTIGDVGPEHWAYRQVVTAVEAGLVELPADKLFKPDQEFRRGELARSLSVMFTLSPALRNTDLTGRLVVKKGKATVTGSDGVANKVEGETKVGAGVKITTGDKTQADISFDDGSGIQLEANAEITIDKAIGFNYMKKDGSPGVAVDKLVIKLKNGRIFGALASRYTEETQPAGGKTSLMNRPALLASLGIPPGMLLAEGEAGSGNSEGTTWWNEPYAERERVVVDMPWGVAAIRGTFWTNNVTSSGQSSTSLIIGHAVVTSGGITVSVTAGQSTVVTTSGAPPAPPAALTTAEKQAWVAVANWVVERAQEIQNSLPPPPAPVIQSPETPVDKPVTPVEQQNPEQQQQVTIDVVGTVTQSLSQTTGVSIETLTNIINTINTTETVTNNTKTNDTITNNTTTNNLPAGGGGGGGGGSTGASYQLNTLTIDINSVSGSFFSLPITLHNASDIYAVSFKISFNNSCLEAVSVQPNTSAFPLVIANDVDNTAGTVRMIASKQGSTAGVGGNIQVGTVTFRVVGNGTSNLNFVEGSLCDSIPSTVTPVLQNTAISVSTSTIGGGLPENRVWLDTSGVSGSQFSIPIKASYASDLYGADVTVSFDRAKLQAMSITANTDQFPLVVVSSTDNNNGTVSLVLTRQGNVSGLTGEVTLGTITFSVLSPGTSLLSFTNARLCDSQLNYTGVNAVNSSISF